VSYVIKRIRLHNRATVVEASRLCLAAVLARRPVNAKIREKGVDGARTRVVTLRGQANAVNELAEKIRAMVVQKEPSA
jgi:hypothetical protein